MSPLKPWAFLLLTLVAVTASEAQQLMPQFEALSLGRGQRTHLEYEVTNTQNFPLRCVIELRGMAPDIEGLPRPSDSYERGCGDWLTAAEDTVFLDPAETRTVKVEVAVPRDAAGGHYGLLRAYFRAADPALDAFDLSDRGSVTNAFFPPMLVESIVLIDVRARGNLASVAIDSLHISPRRNTGAGFQGDLTANAGSWQVDLVLSNEGNTHTRAAGTAAIWRSNGDFVGKNEFRGGRGYVLPGLRRVFHARGREPLSDGTYIARLDIRLENIGRRQEVTPFHVLDGVASPGEPDPDTRGSTGIIAPTLRDEGAVHPEAHQAGTRNHHLGLIAKSKIGYSPPQRCADLLDCGHLGHEPPPVGPRPCSKRTLFLGCRCTHGNHCAEANGNLQNQT